MQKDSCPIFGVQSSIPVIGLGILLILFALIPLVMPGMAPVPFPVGLIIIGFGLFLVWLGFTH